MRVGGPQAPSPPSPGRLSCTRTLYPVFGFRFINVTFSLGSTRVGESTHITQSQPRLLPPSSLQPLPPFSPYPFTIHSLLSSSSSFLHSYFIPHCTYTPAIPSCLPLTHNGRPAHGAVLGPIVQANRGDGSIPRERDQWRDHKLAALLGQEPRCSQRHWGHCQKTQGKALPIGLS